MLTAHSSRLRRLALDVSGWVEKGQRKCKTKASTDVFAIQGILLSLSFGGSGNGGMGRHHDIEGFREFFNLKCVFTRTRGAQDMILAFHPPYAARGEVIAEAAYKHALGLA